MPPFCLNCCAIRQLRSCLRCGTACSLAKATGGEVELRLTATLVTLVVGTWRRNRNQRLLGLERCIGLILTGSSDFGVDFTRNN